LSGRTSAALNNWNWNVRAQLAGKTQLISVQQMLAQLGVATTPPLLGWVFTDAAAASKHGAITAFLDASFETERALLSNDSAWVSVRPLMDATDDALFTAMRDAYRRGIVRSYDPSDTKPIEQSFELLAKYGGEVAVGNLSALPDGTLYKGYSKS
jgi:NitT/TauT family transport system substrate-binding protein